MKHIFSIAMLGAVFMSVAQVSAEEGDAAAGAKVFRKCAACHNVLEPINKVGPHLVSIVDRPVASVQQYKYSKAMIAFAEGASVWDETLLRDYLVAPRAMVKGTRMAFAGIRKPKEMNDLLAYLKEVATAQ